MLTEQQKEYIIKRLHEKGIGINTQDCVLEYCEVNAKLYANVIPIKDIVDRVVNNLDEDIKYYGKISYSRYNTKEKNIKLSLLEHGKSKNNTIFHELDHVATSSKDNLKQANGNKRQEILVCGIDMDLSLNGGKLISFTGLNEGITEYKVMKYVNYLKANRINVERYRLKSCYLPYINVISQLVDIVGEDTIIKDQFYGDIIDLFKKFEQQVQGKYNIFQIVDDMNNSTWMSIKNLFHPIRTIKAKKQLREKLTISKLIKKCTDLEIELSKEEMNEKDLKDIIHSNYKRTKENKRIDFIPKVKVKGIPMQPSEAYKGKNILER